MSNVIRPSLTVDYYYYYYSTSPFCIICSYFISVVSSIVCILHTLFSPTPVFPNFPSALFPKSLYLHLSSPPPFPTYAFCFSFSPHRIILNELFPGSYIKVLLTDSRCRILKRRYILANNVPKESYLSALLHSSLPCLLPSPLPFISGRGKSVFFRISFVMFVFLGFLFSLYLLD